MTPAPLIALLLATPPTPSTDASTDTDTDTDTRTGTNTSTPSSPPPPALTPTARAAARSLYAQGLARLKSGRLDEAVRLLSRAHDKDPDNVPLETDLGFALGKAGRRAEAEAALRSAIDKDPHRFYGYLNLADLLADDPARWERRDRVVAFLEKGLEELREDTRGRLLVLLRLANFERVVGRTAAARARLAPLLAPGRAPPLTREQRKRVLDLLEAIALDERAQALEDWPTPPPDAAAIADASAAAQALDEGRVEAARSRLDAIVARAPSWPRARLLRARAQEALGHVDEAVRDLEIAVNLSPSSGQAWRALGRLLALHGGALEAERADQALRNALTLEPAWSDLRALRAQLARRRAAPESALAPASAHHAEPSPKARALFQEAEEWIEVGDPAGLGRDLLEQALADSPGYVDAAVTAYSITGAVLPETPAALWDDGPSLWALAAGVRRLGKDGAADALTPPWVDRAVELDVQEARFARAVARGAAGDRAGALGDLVAYLAREPRPPHLAEARALRAGLGHGDGRAEGRPSAERLARIRLLEDRPDAALDALGGACAAGLPGDRLRALGLVHEYGDRRAAARVCYQLAAAAGDDVATTRLGRLDARLPDAELAEAGRSPEGRAALNRAAGQGVAAAHFALGRLAAAAGDDAVALARADRALALAGAGVAGVVPDVTAGSVDGWVADARAMRDGLVTSRLAQETARRERRRRLGAGGAAVLVALAVLLVRRRFKGWTVAAALRRSPALFPEVGRAIAEIRHDVLKHRAGVLGLVAQPGARRDDIRRALTEPQPTSVVVAEVYDRLARAARGLGMDLRALPREPVFGALARDLALAEALAAGHAGGDAALLACDRRLRGIHADRLTALMQLGPRTRLDAAELAGWIDAARAAARREGTGWAAPALMLGDLAVEFPVERGALGAIFANLLRNAQAAVAGADDPRVIVRVDRGRDVTGRQVANLFVGDSSPAPLTLEAIEARESGRGLAIVRDLVRQWRGHLVVCPDPAPFTKQVGACFPS